MILVPRNHRRPVGGSGFTLIELLATMAIISIILTFMLGAVWVAQESTRGAQTETMIAKLHNVIIERWESYRTRRVSLQTSPVFVANTPANRLVGIRELMRMEMPDRYEDVIFTPTVHTQSGLQTTYQRRIDSALRKYNAANGTSLTRAQFVDTILADDGAGRNPNEGAECLYLIIMASMPADERVSFRHKEYGDTNNNYMPEFLDAWGTPIRFLRWAPGVQSDVQIHNPVDYHDPFDPFALQMGWQSSNINRNPPPVESGEPTPFNAGSIQVWGYSILPYIYSAGADHEFGINQALIATPASGTILAKNRNPYSRYNDGSGNYLWRGEPVPSSTGDTVHFDNIHNHNPQGARR